MAMVKIQLDDGIAYVTPTHVVCMEKSIIPTHEVIHMSNGRKYVIRVGEGDDTNLRAKRLLTGTA